MPQMEANSSVTYSVISKDGFPLLFTVRGESGKVLLDTLETVEKKLLEKGYKPQIKKTFGEKKPVETVPDRKCPKCSQPLVYQDIKGQKVIKCSTNKWNPITKQAEGCSYIEWPDKA